MKARRIQGFLSRSEIQKIHQASLELLSEVGIKVGHPVVRQLLIDAGAKEGSDSALLLPPSLIEESLRKTPRSIRFADLSGNVVEVKAGGPPLFWTGNALFYVRGSERKEMTRDFYVEFCRVADQLRNLHAIVGTSLSEYPPGARDFVGFRAMAENSQKHLRPVIFTPKGIEVILEMADVLLDGKTLKEHPIFSLGFTAVSPLRWSDSALEVFRASSGYGIPLMINSEVISGTTGPVTLSGSLVLANAEALSGITIAQLLEPRRPVVFNLGFSHIFDMRVAETLTGSPEGGLLGAAGGAIARFHHLPSASWMSTESKIPDAQAAYEKTLLGLLHALGGVNLIWGIGNLDSTLSLSPEQAVIDDELAGGILRSWMGIETNEEKMAVPLIKALKHQAAYLQSEHTLRHFREELRITKLLSRERWAVWEKGGRKGLTSVAETLVQSLLKIPPPDHLSGSQLERLKKIEKRYLEEME
ncbi:MAG: trimethylamine methyltransferase family protein [Thermodesulfobacteriota bacterium]